MTFFSQDNTFPHLSGESLFFLNHSRSDWSRDEINYRRRWPFTGRNGASLHHSAVRTMYFSECFVDSKARKKLVNCCVFWVNLTVCQCMPNTLFFITFKINSFIRIGRVFFVWCEWNFLFDLWQCSRRIFINSWTGLKKNQFCTNRSNVKSIFFGWTLSCNELKATI